MTEERSLEVEARLAGTRRRPADRLHLERADLLDEEFSRRKLDAFSAVGSRFTRCRFERMTIDDAGFGAGVEVSHYLDCSFDGSRIRAPAPGLVRFERCSFRDVRLREWICRTVDFVDCVFTGRADKIIVRGRDDERGPNEVHGNDFSGMSLRDVAFRAGIDLTKQRLPSGKDYLLLLDAHESIAFVRAEVSRWDDDVRREKALLYLRLFTTELEEGQEQLFLRTDDYARGRDASLVRDLFALLTAGSRER